MHELALTQSIVEACSERARGTRVLRVTLEIGALSGVAADAIRFCYELCSAGTPLAASELEIIEIPARSHCLACGREVELRSVLDACDCGSIDLADPRGGDELSIRSMEVA